MQIMFVDTKLLNCDLFGLVLLLLVPVNQCSVCVKRMASHYSSFETAEDVEICNHCTMLASDIFLVATFSCGVLQNHIFMCFLGSRMFVLVIMQIIKCVKTLRGQLS